MLILIRIESWRSDKRELAVPSRCRRVGDSWVLSNGAERLESSRWYIKYVDRISIRVRIDVDV